MFLLLLLSVLISAVTWYFWKTYSPFLSFHNYFFGKWHIIVALLRGKGPQNKSVNAYLFQVFVEFCKKHFAEGLAVIWIFEPVVVIYGPDAIKFFANEASVFDKPWPYQLIDVFDKDALFKSSGKRVKELRKLLRPVFYPRMMLNFITTMNDHALYLVQELGQLEKQTVKDLEKFVKRRTFMIFCEATFGIKVDSKAKDSRMDVGLKSINSCMEFVIYRLYRPWMRFDFMLNFTSEGRKHMKNVKNLQYFYKQIIEEMKELYDIRTRSKDHNETETYLPEQHKKCFGEVLLEEQLKDSSLTTKELETELITIFSAAFDTVSYSLMWSLWLLGLHPVIQEKAYEEVKTISDEVIDYEEIRKMTYLECIIKESLRIYPVLPVFARVSKKDLYFEKYKTPAGTQIVFTPYIAHVNPEFYPEPEEFNPDRFSEKDSRMTAWNFIPFAESVRSCLGKNYGMLLMKVLLAHVVRNFKIVSLTPREDVEIYFEIFLKSSIPLSVKFIPR